MKTLAILLAGAIGLSGAAQAKEWRIVDASRRNIAAVDRSSIRTEGAQRTYWAAIVDAQADDDGGKYSVIRFTMDCDQETIRIVALTRYADFGRPVDQVAAPYQQLQIFPGSLAEQMKKAVCEGDWLTVPGFAELSDFVSLAARTLSRQTEE